MGRTCLQFSVDELFQLWKPFANDPDHGAEALAGFMGLPTTAPARAVMPMILKFQQRAAQEADKDMLESALGYQRSNQ